MDSLTADQLLDDAEDNLELAHASRDAEGVIAASLASIAASLLVIARKS